MKILFAASIPFAIEPLGLMTLIAICKKADHEVQLAFLRKEEITKRVERFAPDVVAYSTSTADIRLFEEADKRLRDYLAREERNSQDRKRPPFRIMGGPHPTYTPAVIDALKLDAICQGDGDHALPELLRRLDAGQDLHGIPNIGLTADGAETKELVADLDDIPFADRDTYYQMVPYCRISGMRSIVTGRGCPYSCSYCFNHAFKELFEGCGRILRRRSVENVLEEIEYVRRYYPPLKLIRFSDDTFTHRVDAWLEEFCEKYPARIGAPFYCLMRPNTLTEDTAKLLAQAGCRAIGMSIESGSERLRGEVLHRPISDETIIHSFEVARKYKLRTYVSTMVAIPGSTLEDDFHSLEFSRSIQPSAAIFPICTPYRGTQLWKMAVDKGYLDKETDPVNKLGEATALTCFSPREKQTQLSICYLGPIYCAAPSFFRPILLRLIRANLPYPLVKFIGANYMIYRIATRVFTEGIPRTPRSFFRLVYETVRYLS